MDTGKIAEEKETSQTLKFFLELSEACGLSIAFGMAETGRDKRNIYIEKAVNKCYLVSGGKILLEYAKIHPFTYGEEAKYYQGGTELAIAEQNQIRLAPLICYDLRFPEPFQILSAQAEFIFVIANWPIKRVEHWDTLLKARAIENQCYIAGINRCGTDPGNAYPMASRVYDPYGNRIDTLKEGSSESGILDGNLYFAHIDKRTVQKYREEFPLKKDRREQLYLSLKTVKKKIRNCHEIN